MLKESAPNQKTGVSFLRKLTPALAFLVFLLWHWRIYDLSANIPAYGDILEIMWGINWYKAQLLSLSNSPFFTPTIFYPDGWHLLTSANGIGAFLLLVPLALFANEAFAYNLLALLMTAVTFTGMYLLSKQYTSNRLTLTLAALLFTFWPARWLRLRGHITIFIGTGLLPWLVYCLERAFASAEHRWRWLILAGGIWALTMSFSLYFIWLSGLVLLCWLMGCFLNGRLSWKEALQNLLITTGTMLLLSLTFIIPFWQARQHVNAVPFSFSEINSWGVNMNSLISPILNHTWPFLQNIARQIYTGPIDETSTLNFGFLVFALLVVSFIIQLRQRLKQWLPLTLLTLTGLILALGPTLQWNNTAVAAPGFSPLSQAIWQTGYTLKPDVFLTEQMPEQMAQAIPLPGFLLTAVLPFYESARVSARFALAASLGIFLLIALTLEKIRWRWLQWLLAGLLLLAFLPKPLPGVPFPPPPHPAYTWLKEHSPANAGSVLELYAYEPNKLIMPIGGETVWAAQYHQRPIVSGASSIWSDNYDALRNWFFGHSQPLLDQELSQIMQNYDVSTILVQIRNPADMAMIEAAGEQGQLEFIDCFEPEANGRVWHYPICVFTIQ